MSDATVIIGPWKGQVIHLNPVQPFGRRGTPVIGRLPGSLGEVLDVALGCERPSDRAEQSRIKAAARAARDAHEGRSAVCPSLILSVANRVTGLALAAEHLAAEAKSLGLLKASVSLRDHAGLLEALAAEIEPEQSL